MKLNPFNRAVFKDPSVWVLLGVNLIPFVGVFFWDWDIFSLMVLYWMETAMVGFFQIIKILINIPVFSVIYVPFFCVHFGGFMTGHLTAIETIFGPPAYRIWNGNFLGCYGILGTLLFQNFLWVSALALFMSYGLSFYLHDFKKKKPLAVESSDVPTAPSSSYHSTEDWQHTIDSTPVRPEALEKPDPIEKYQETFDSLPEGLKKEIQDVADNDPGKMMSEPYKRVVIMHLTILFGGFLSLVLKTPVAAFVLMVVLKIVADLWSHANYRKLGQTAPVPEGSTT